MILLKFLNLGNLDKTITPSSGGTRLLTIESFEQQTHIEYFRLQELSSFGPQTAYLKAQF